MQRTIHPDYGLTKVLIPARHSRHRTACLALYRALLRLTPRVPLPADLQSTWRQQRFPEQQQQQQTSSRRPALSSSNPIAEILRRAFERNRPDTSPRIIQPALKAGYGALALLQAARDPSSAEHAEVVAFLAERRRERERTVAALAANPRFSRRRGGPPLDSKPKPGRAPLLVNATPPPTAWEPEPAPVYATPSRPRPLAKLRPGAVRRVPRLDMAGDFPFLRLTKPQPAVLSRVLRQKINRRVARLNLFMRLKEVDVECAAEEDEWEHLVAELEKEQQQRQRRRPRSGGGSGNDAPVQTLQGFEPLYQACVEEHGIAATGETLTREKRDNIARAKAMFELIQEEKELVRQEQEERRARKKERWIEGLREKLGDRWDHNRHQQEAR